MVFLGAHGVQVRVSAWMGAALRGAVNTGHRSESWKVNSCHNQGGGGQVSSQSSFTFTPEDLDVRVSVGGFCCDADSDWGGLSCSPALVTGDQQQWPSQPRGRAQPGDQPSPLGSNLTQICSTECVGKSLARVLEGRMEFQRKPGVCPTLSPPPPAHCQGQRLT